MKSKIIFIALYSAAFMFPSIGSVDTAGAQTDISHCDAFSGPALAACVDAAHGSSPAPFDDGLMGAPAMDAPGMTAGMPGTGMQGGNSMNYGTGMQGGNSMGMQGGN
jgi:hypothetical protein